MHIKTKTAAFRTGFAVLAASAVLALTGSSAWAQTASELREKADAVENDIANMQVELDSASDAYFGALEDKEEAESAAADAQNRIDEAEERIDALQERLGKRAVDMYKRGTSEGALDMLLSSGSLDEFLNTWHYLTCMAGEDANMISENEKLKESVLLEKMYAEEQAMLAETKADEAEKIKADIEVKIADYEAQWAELDEQARDKAREEAITTAMSTYGGMSGNYSAATDIPANGSVVDYAYSRLGCPYVWAASGPDSFDCSGLVMWCYDQAGVSLPHNSESQYSAAAAVLPVSAAKPGDVLYMPGHVGICISDGGGAYIHAPHSGDVVRVATWPMFSCALRF